jgi:hypothetical protein
MTMILAALLIATSPVVAQAAPTHNCEIVRYAQGGKTTREKAKLDGELKVEHSGQRLSLKGDAKSTRLELRTAVPRSPASDQDYVLSIECDRVLNCQGSRKVPGRAKADAFRVEGGGSETTAKIGQRPFFRYSTAPKGFIYRYVETQLAKGKYTGFDLECREGGK